MNKFINSKSFNVLVYTVGGIALLCSELKRLAILKFRGYSKDNGKKV